MGGRRKKATDQPPPYVSSQLEREATARVGERRARRAPSPQFKIEQNGPSTVRIAVDHPDPPMGHVLLADALATGDFEFSSGLLTQLVDASRSGKIATKRELDFMLALVRGMRPSRGLIFVSAP